MPKIKIVAICQVRNEDLFIEQALLNILDFCDDILVADHHSLDQTASIVKRLAGHNPKIRYTLISHPRDAHEMVRPYCNTPTWIFAVDGDEVYDPTGLARLRKEILAGELESYRQIYGNVLHCVAFDQQSGIAKGYLSPPSRSMTKLYNFNALYDWEGPCLEKCLGGHIRFKDGYSENSNLLIQNQMEWDDSYFRCLHTVFLRRSSAEPVNVEARANVVEIYGKGTIGYLKYRWRKLMRRSTASEYKKDQYRRGKLVAKRIELFWAESGVDASH